MQIVTQLMNLEGFTSCTFHKEHKEHAHFLGANNTFLYIVYKRLYSNVCVFTSNNVA